MALTGPGRLAAYHHGHANARMSGTLSVCESQLCQVCSGVPSGARAASSSAEDDAMKAAMETDSWDAATKSMLLAIP
jgi:hypothetical protein